MFLRLSIMFSAYFFSDKALCSTKHVFIEQSFYTGKTKFKQFTKK